MSERIDEILARSQAWSQENRERHGWEGEVPSLPEARLDELFEGATPTRDEIDILVANARLVKTLRSIMVDGLGRGW